MESLLKLKFTQGVEFCSSWGAGLRELCQAARLPPSPSFNAMQLEHLILFSSVYPEVVRSQAPDVALSGPSQSWGRKGAGVSDVVQCNKLGWQRLPGRDAGRASGLSENFGT